MTSIIPDLVTRLWAKSLSDLKADIVQGTVREASFGGHRDLSEHVEMVRREFVGQAELLLYHAILMVFVRRQIDLQNTLSRTWDLWRCEGPFLTRNLNSRWLVSACDTIADHNPDTREKALAIAGTLFANTVKLYETERWAIDGRDDILPHRPISGRIELHDGMTAFLIGHGDMIHNLHKRVNSVSAGDSASATILRELLQRASKLDTVFPRFREAHRNRDTAW